MADIKSKQARSLNMAAIKSKDTKPELKLRKALWVRGYRFRKNYKELPGTPDIVLTKYKICIFVDSEYFHGKNFNSGYHSKKYKSLREQLEHSNHPEFWIQKIQNNMQHDEQINNELQGLGWKVIRFWSQDVIKNENECISRIEKAIWG